MSRALLGRTVCLSGIMFQVNWWTMTTFGGRWFSVTIFSTMSSAALTSLPSMVPMILPGTFRSPSNPDRA